MGTVGHGSAPHKDLVDLYGQMSGEGGSVSETHRPCLLRFVPKRRLASELWVTCVRE